MRSLRFLPWLVCVAWVLLLTPPPAALAATFTTPSLQGIDLGEGLLFLEDPTGTLTLDDIRHGQHDWQTNEANIFNRGYNASAWWLQLRLTNPHATPQWLLEIAYAVLDHIDVYVVRPNGDVRLFPMGDKRPFRARPLLHRHFLVPLDLAQGEQVDLYLRVHTTSSVQVPLTLWEPASFYVEDTGHNVAEGIYYGGVLIIALYNLLLYLVLGERTYLYYVGTVLSTLMFIACLHGWSFQFLWPSATRWNDMSILFFLATLMVFGWAFTNRFLDARSISRLFRVANASATLISLMMIAVALLVPYNIAIRIIIPLATASCVWGMVTGFAAWHKGNSSARYYILA